MYRYDGVTALLTRVTIEGGEDGLGADLPLPVILHPDHERHGAVLVAVPVRHRARHVQADPARHRAVLHHRVQHHLHTALQCVYNME